MYYIIYKYNGEENSNGFFLHMPIVYDLSFSIEIEYKKMLFNITIVKS